MRSHHRSLCCLALVHACGLATGLAHADITADAASDGRTPPSAETRAAVLATFSHTDDGAPAKVLPAAPARTRTIAPWDRPTRAVPAELAAAELPTYYLYEGNAVAMRVNTSLLLAQVSGVNARELAAAAAAKAGLPVKAIRESGIGGYLLIETAQPMAGEGGINATINLLLTDPTFAYIAPVYHNPEIADGILAMLPEINVRASQANALRIDELVRDSAKDHRITQREIAGLMGSAQIVGQERNGFDVLRTANRLAVNTDFAWACPTMLSTMDLHAVVPNDQFWGGSTMWGWNNLGLAGQVAEVDTDADQAWELTFGNSGVIVLCLDLGSDQFHPDINQLSGQSFTDGSVNGNGNGQPITSCDNHGTPVAGIISGRINNSIGGAGVCPNGRTLSAKVGSTPEPDPNQSCGGAWAGTGGTTVTLDVRIANAILWGETQGARISNGSFGVGTSDVLTDAYTQTEANGMLHFASAGNSSTGTVGYPGRLSVCQGVSAIDADGTLSSFSNWGVDIDFCAPGTNVRAADRSGAVGYDPSDYTVFSGTSAASPFAAGVAALIWSAYPHFDKSTIVNLMKFYAMDLGASGFDNFFGWGFPNANSSIRAVFPQNNWCDLATTIGGPVFTPAPFSTGNASEVPEELDEACELNNVGVSHSVWYRYVPPCDGELSINTNGSDYDTVLSVWRGGCDSATAIGCDDDGGTGTQSQINNLEVQVGQTYYIKISAYGVNSAGGQLDFNFVYTPDGLINDHCSDAIDIPFNELVYNVCTIGADTTPCEGDESCGATLGNSHSVWYEFTTPSIGRFDLNTAGSGYDTVLSVWRGGCGSYITIGNQILCTQVPVAVICNDDYNGDTRARLVDVNADAFTTYRFKIDAYSDNEGGDLNFHFHFRSCPADYNHSGAVTVQDIFDFLSGYFANDPAANFNNFSGITVQDIFDFLAAYFNGQCE